MHKTKDLKWADNLIFAEQKIGAVGHKEIWTDNTTPSRAQRLLGANIYEESAECEWTWQRELTRPIQEYAYGEYSPQCLKTMRNLFVVLNKTEDKKLAWFFIGACKKMICLLSPRSLRGHRGQLWKPERWAWKICMLRAESCWWCRIGWMKLFTCMCVRLLRMIDYNKAASCTDGMHVGCLPLPHVDICCLFQRRLQNLFKQARFAPGHSFIMLKFKHIYSHCNETICTWLVFDAQHIEALLETCLQMEIDGPLLSFFKGRRARPCRWFIINQRV